MKRIIDLEGNFLRDDFIHDEETEIALDVEPAQGLYQPRWNGESWEEGATKEYIDDLKAQATPQEPTLEDKVNEHEVKIVTIEEEINVIFGSGE